MSEQEDGWRFLGDLEGYLQFSRENPRWNPQWCPEHWAPCPVEGKPGLLASVMLMQHATTWLYPPDAMGTASQMNSWMENQTVPFCCQIEKRYPGWMASLWEEVSAGQGFHLEEGQTMVDNPDSVPCKAKYPFFPYSPLKHCYGKLMGHERCAQSSS